MVVTTVPFAGMIWYAGQIDKASVHKASFVTFIESIDNMFHGQHTQM